jgi:hypothetical protein
MTEGMIGAGFLLHFLSRYGEHWRTNGRVKPMDYLALDPIGWASAVVGTLVITVAFKELAPIIGVDPSSLGGALIAGYTGSSLTAKLPGLAGRGGTR